MVGFVDEHVQHRHKHLPSFTIEKRFFNIFVVFLLSSLKLQLIFCSSCVFSFGWCCCCCSFCVLLSRSVIMSIWRFTLINFSVHYFYDVLVAAGFAIEFAAGTFLLFGGGWTIFSSMLENLWNNKNCSNERSAKE